jgi:hypothetical protein
MTQRALTHWFASSRAPPTPSTVWPDGQYIVLRRSQYKQSVRRLGTRRPSHPCLHRDEAQFADSDEFIDKPARFILTALKLEHRATRAVVGTFWHTALSRRPMRDVYEGVIVAVRWDPSDTNKIARLQPITY